ncbi:MAG: hypothetical protein VKJ85_00095, partial [Prochlorothrix sp.]|nr:hypothetical protein [Prochlorothrix sp.]
MAEVSKHPLNWSSDTPTFVFSENLTSSNEKSVAEAISHEVGHTLGLSHDGRTAAGEDYYTGHNGWAPIMGAGYYQDLTQWSKGEYDDASNREDDLSIITTRNGFGYRTDDVGDTRATAKILGLWGTSVSDAGIIERNTDADFFSFVAWAGSVNLNIKPYEAGSDGSGANLNVAAFLYNAAGSLLTSSNPVGSLAATIATTLTT